MRVRGGRERLRARVARREASHTYVSVLLLIVADFVFVASAPDHAWARAVLLVLGWATLVAALWASGLTAGQRPRLAALAVAATIVAVLQLVVGGGTVAGSSWIAGVLLVGATIVALGVGVFDQGEVNPQSVLGAICIYLLLGFVFTGLYGAIAALGSGSLFAQSAGDGTASLRQYFSYVTLATLGYGDLTPAGSVGRSLAVTEALLGQLYLVTVVAVLVSRVGRARAD